MAEDKIKNLIEEFRYKHIRMPFIDQGRSEKGVDCWGLVVLLYKNCFGINVRSMHNYSYRGLLSAVKAMSGELKDSGEWDSIPVGEEKPGDVILFKLGCSGIILGDQRALTSDLGGVHSVYYGDMEVKGIYRNKELMKSKLWTETN